MDQCVNAAGGGEAGAEQHQQQIARRPGNEAGDHCCAPSSKALQRRLQVAFRIDQEVRGDDDGLAVGNALADLHVSGAAVAGLDLAWLQSALSLVDEDGLAAAGIHHRALRHGQDRLARPGVDLRVDVHVVQQREVGVRQFDADARGTGLLVDLGIDHLDLSRKLAPGKAPGPHGRHLAFGDHAEIAFRDVDQRPHHGMIRDPKHHAARLARAFPRSRRAPGRCRRAATTTRRKSARFGFVR